jgi:hypothetical protein
VDGSECIAAAAEAETVWTVDGVPGDGAGAEGGRTAIGSGVMGWPEGMFVCLVLVLVWLGDERTPGVCEDWCRRLSGGCFEHWMEGRVIGCDEVHQLCCVCL